MDLWIRTQSKEELTKPIDLQIISVSDSTEYAIISFTEMSGDITLGFYKSKERALEVLDEIQNTILLKQMLINNQKELFESLKRYKNEEIEKLYQQMAVYEMPEK